MPNYDFTCPKGHRVERYFKITEVESKRVKCPLCARKMKREIGAGAGVLFKGSGFYSTDHRSDGYKSSGAMHSEMAKMDERLRKADPL